MNPRSWSVFKRQAGRVRVPVLRPGEAEAMLKVEHARQQAERQQAQARFEADLAQHQAFVDAGVEPAQPPLETTVDGFMEQF